MKISAKIRKSSNLIFRIVLATLVYIFLYIELKEHKEQFDFQNIWESGFKNFKFVLFALLLMPVNWLIESIKWQFLIKKVENVNLGSSVKAVFAGTAISIFTPNRIGDYLGRIFILKKGDRIDGTIATIVGNLSQLLMTILIGGISLVYYSYPITQYLFGNNHLQSAAIVLVFIILIVLILLYFNFPLIEQGIYNRFKLQKIPLIKHIKLLSEYNKKDLLLVLILSFSRYLVYSLQFYLLLLAFDVPLSILDGLMLVSLTFFSLTVIPSIAVAELGLRALVTMAIFEIIGTGVNSDIALVSATSSLWLINIALASIIGGIFIFQLRFFRKNKIDS